MGLLGSLRPRHGQYREGKVTTLNNAIFKRLLVFAVPGMVLMAAYAALPYISSLPPSAQENAGYAPYVISAAGLLLSLHFNRSRAFFVLLVLFLAHWSMSRVPSPPLFDALCLLLPFNITLFCFMREKGLLTFSGRMRFGFILFQVALITWLVKSGPGITQAAAAQGFVAQSGLPSLTLPQAAIPLMITGLALIAAKTLIRQNPIDSGMFGALACVAVTCNWIEGMWLPAVFTSAGSLAVALGVLQDSHNMAFRDELTGLPSRRALNEEMGGLGRRYVIAMLDVDHFKRVNDTYGHDVGDQVLKMVAGKIRSVVSGGKPYRYGGEEFAMVFPGKTLADVIPRLEDVRRTVADYRLWLRADNRPVRAHEGRKLRAGRYGQTYVSVTISIGAAERNDNLRIPDEVLKAADHALYRAKNRGRNRLCS